jgi:hypothetical protein
MQTSRHLHLARFLFRPLFLYIFCCLQFQKCEFELNTTTKLGCERTWSSNPCPEQAAPPVVRFDWCPRPCLQRSIWCASPADLLPCLTLLLIGDKSGRTLPVEMASNSESGSPFGHFSLDSFVAGLHFSGRELPLSSLKCLRSYSPPPPQLVQWWEGEVSCTWISKTELQLFACPRCSAAGKYISNFTLLRRIVTRW